MDVADVRGSKKRKRTRLTYRGAAPDDSGSEDLDIDEYEHQQMPTPNSGLTKDTAVVVVDNGFSTTTQDSETYTTPIAVGGALRKNSDGSVITPHVVKKRGTKSVCPSLFFPSVRLITR